MSGISLITKGMICQETITIINRYVMPYNLQIESQPKIELAIVDQMKLNLNLLNICDKTINLKLTDKNVNVKKSDSTDINIDT